MSVSAEEMRDADARCLDAAEVLLDALEDLPSPAAFQRAVSEIGRARSLARAIAPRDAPEGLLARHLDASWAALEQVIRYRFEWPAVSIEAVLDAIAGPGALDRLESVLEGLDAARCQGYLELRHGFRTGRVPPDSPEARPALERTTERLSRAFRAWLAEREGPLPGLDAEVVLGPADTDRAWYEPSRHRVVIGPGEFMVFRRSGGLVVNPVGAARSLAHELAGHAVQDALSRDLPEPLRPDHRGRLRFASLPASEGFADWRASLAVPFLEDRRKEFELEERDLDVAREMTRLAFVHHAVPACLGALAARERQEPGFDAVSHLARRVGHPGFGERLSRTEVDSVNRIVYHAACYFGLQMVEDAASTLLARGIDRSRAARALGHGAWSHPCYRDAVLGAAD